MGILLTPRPYSVSEITPSKIRGAAVGAYQFSITLGLLLAACVNLATQKMNDSGAYRIPIALQLVWASILGIGLMFMPRSPRWYLMKNRNDEAKIALARLRRRPKDAEDILAEHKELERSWTVETRQASEGRSGSGWLDCFKGGIRRGSNLHRTFIGTEIQMMQQLSMSPCPINAVPRY